MPLKLHAGHLMEHLERKPIMLNLPDGPPVPLTPKMKQREKLLGPLVPKIDKARKYIFNSGSDREPEQLDSIRNTAISMLDFDLFHLPAPIVFVEDPFDKDPDGMRYYYLMEEDKDARTISVHFFARLRETRLIDKDMDYTYIPYAFFKDLNTSDDAWGWAAEKPIEQMAAGSPWWPLFEKPFTEAMYACTKFLVILSTTNHIQEKDPGKPFKQRIPYQFREYPHTLIKLPERVTWGKEKSGKGTGAKRSFHFVDGYVWGKNTRPREEQRFIYPYFRGSQEVGVVERTHTEVRA
jgi:hypothetical protein